MGKRGSLEILVRALPKPPALPMFDLWRAVNEVADYPGVYIIMGAGTVDRVEEPSPWGDAVPVYVGESRNIRRRLKCTTHPVGSSGNAFLTTKIPNLKDRLYLEAYLIGLYRPPFNWANRG